MDALTTRDPNRLHSRLVELGEAWADADAAASLLEEQKKTVLAQLMSMSQANSSAAKETEALATPLFREHVEKMVEARRVANRMLVNYKSAQVWVDLARSVEATRRAEMRL